MIIYQADVYDIPIKITMNGKLVSPSTADDVTIVIGNMIRTHKKGDLRFDGEYWIFPLSEETRKLEGVVQGQAQVKIGENKIHTQVFAVKFAPSVKPFVKGDL